MSINRKQAQWDKRLEFYDKLIALNPNFVRRGKVMPYTSANGHMFSMLNKRGEIGIKLPKDSLRAFMKEYKALRFKSHGYSMRDYVLIPETLFENIKLLNAILQQAYDYVTTLNGDN